MTHPPLKVVNPLYLDAVCPTEGIDGLDFYMLCLARVELTTNRLVNHDTLVGPQHGALIQFLYMMGLLVVVG